MIHTMNLQPQPFAMIANGQKTYELRLDDEKRRLIAVGDEIVFTNTAAPEQTMCVRVVGLHRYENFAALYAALPLEQCGYRPEEIATASPADMEAYYTPEKQRKYGVLGIEIERCPHL